MAFAFSRWVLIAAVLLLLIILFAVFLLRR